MVIGQNIHLGSDIYMFLMMNRKFNLLSLPSQRSAPRFHHPFCFDNCRQNHEVLLRRAAIADHSDARRAVRHAFCGFGRLPVVLRLPSARRPFLGIQSLGNAVQPIG